MSDEAKQQERESARQPMADPRLQQQRRALTTVQWAALIAGWAAALGLIVLLFWMAITRSFGLGPKIVLGATVALGVFWAVVHWESIKSALRSRGVRLGTNSFAFVLLVLGILILINYIAARHHWRHDFTENQRYSLSEQTREVVKGLDKDVTIIAFLEPEPSPLRDRLREYNMLSPKLKLEIYDPVTDRAKVEEYNVMSRDTLVIKCGDKQEKVIGGGEEQITSAILAVTSGEKTRIYFLTGHGERSIEDTGPRGLGTIKANLENQQYDVKALNLATQEKPQVPADCAVLVIAGPTEPLRDKELEAIKAYADQGGNLLVALEPNGPSLKELLEPYGIQPYEGMVYDPQWGFYGSSNFPVVADYTEHEITQGLAQIGVALPTTRAFDILDETMDESMAPDMPPDSNLKTRPLLKTSADSWVETGSLENASRDPSEPRGPLTVALLYDGSMTQPEPYGMTPPEENEDATRMVVLGDADMMTDEVVMSYGVRGNAYFVLNSINWLVANEKLISIPPKNDLPRYLTMNDRQQKFVWALVVGIVPLAIAAAGFIVWWRRR